MHLLDNQVKETLLLSLFFYPNKYLIYFKLQQEALEKNYQNTLWFAFLNIRVQTYAPSWMHEFGCHTREDPYGTRNAELVHRASGVLGKYFSVPGSFFHFPILRIKC